MLVFHPANHAQHAPQWYLADGRTRPCPEVPARLEHLLQSLRTIPSLQFSSPGDLDPSPALKRVHTPDYLEYLRTIHTVWRAEFPTDVLPDTFPRGVGGGGGRPAKRPAKPSAQAGHYCFDLAAPITAGTWPAVFDSARCAVAAADAILRGESSAFSLSRPPGHHAGPDYCGGFCYLNNAAIAAEQLRHSGHERVAILDIDYHHGNGTQDIFYHRSDVLFISLHADPNTQYPYFWGHAEEAGESDGKGFTLNLPLPRGISETDWLRTLDLALTRIIDFRPQSLIISLGVDTMEGDEVGDFRLTPSGFTQTGQKIAALKLPTLFIMEGGYTLAKLGPSVAAVLQGFGLH